MKLRKLTEKSTMNFGKYADMTVSNVMTVDLDYILWAYYNNSHITFFDNILRQVGVTDKHKINKPGKDVEYFKENKWNIFNKMELMSTQERGMYEKLKNQDIKHRKVSNNIHRAKASKRSSLRDKHQSYLR